MEPLSAVTDEDRYDVVLHVDVDVDLLDTRELRSVRHRLACCEDERLFRRRVAGARQLDADAVQLLDVGRDRRERRHERGLIAERPVSVEPTAQLALLAPRESGDPLRFLRVPLDQRQRLQHRVVDARRDLGALVAPDPRRSLGVALESEPP